MSQKKSSANWLLRLPTTEDREIQKLASERGVSKSDVVRHALRLLLRIERETEAGGRLLIKRSEESQEAIEIWHIW